MPGTPRAALDAWTSIPGLVRGLLDDLPEAQLDQRPDAVSMSPREVVHHVVEANVVAASIVIAALGSPGCVYDWSWMLPFGPWMGRLRYDQKPLAPSAALVGAINAYVVALVEPLPDGLERTVQLRDQPGAELRTATVADVLIQEAEHAREHIEAARAGRRDRRS